MWSVWHSRNRIKHNEGGSCPATCMKLTKKVLVILELPRTMALTMALVLPGHGWSPPELGFSKNNTDKAINFDENCSGAGGVARSCTSLLGAWCKPHMSISDPMIDKVLAMREGA